MNKAQDDKANVLARLSAEEYAWIAAVSKKGEMSLAKVFRMVVQMAMKAHPDSMADQIKTIQKEAEMNEIREEMERLEKRRKELEGN